MLGVAASPRVLDKLFHLRRGRGTLQLDSEGDAVKRRSGSLQPKLVGNIEAATNVNLGVFDGNIVKMREPRNLGEQSKSRTHEEQR